MGTVSHTQHPWIGHKLRQNKLKAAPWDDSNFRFYFCIEVVYPPEHDLIFSEFLDF